MVNRIAIGVSLLVEALFLSAGVAFAQDFLFEVPSSQTTGNGNGGPSEDWPENWTFMQLIFPGTYYDGPNNEETAVEYYLIDNDSAPYAQHAENVWEAALPSYYGGFVQTTDQSDADLTIFADRCPSGSAGCITDATWHGLGGPDVNLFVELDLYATLQNDYTDNARRGTMAHEFGHALGLTHHYLPNSCNPNIFSVMDANVRRSDGTVVHCDTDAPTAFDEANIDEYYAAGRYRSTLAYMGGNIFRTRWEDVAWSERNQEVNFYWSLNPSADFSDWAWFSRNFGNDGHGAHEDAADASDRTWEVIAYPSSSGVPSGAYVMGCARAFHAFNSSPGGPAGFSTEDAVCSSPVQTP